MALDRTTSPKSKIELHVHLDGAVRTSTVFDVARRRNLEISARTAEELSKQIVIPIDEASSLTYFLSKFNIFMPIIAGDEEAVKRIAYEYCEDSASNGVIYSEVRYNPHLLSSSVENPDFASLGDLTPHRVVELVQQGLQEGSRDFNTKVTSILACMHHRPEWSPEVLDLCVEFRDRGVVGIDLAGDEQPAELRPADSRHINAFLEAERLGINRTVHAGEQGTIHNITEAVNKMHTQRLGHGYRVIDDENIYAKLRKDGMHFEMCPLSSFTTGSVPKDFRHHPLHRFIEDKAHFSISTDDPTLTGAYMEDEYQFITRRMGVSWNAVYQANINAAEAAFLPENEKQELLHKLKSEYGLL